MRIEVCILIPLLAECPLIQFTAAPSDRTDTPVGSDVEFSCTVNFDVAMKWYIPGNPSLEKIEGKKCNTNQSNCTYTLSIQNVTEDMNQTSFQCKALDHCIPGDVLYSKTALLTGKCCYLHHCKFNAVWLVIETISF